MPGGVGGVAPRGVPLSRSSAQLGPSPRDPRRSAIRACSSHSTYAGRTVGYGQTEKGPASLHVAADEPRTAEMHTDLVPSAGGASSRRSSIVAIRRSPILAGVGREDGGTRRREPCYKRTSRGAAKELSGWPRRAAPMTSSYSAPVSPDWPVR
jgi:hypothetical protein